MPFGFWVLGNTNPSPIHQSFTPLCLKCLSAFGFWGTKSTRATIEQGVAGLKCLSAFGFWGTADRPPRRRKDGTVSNAFRLLGSGERCGTHYPLRQGNRVSNAFRLLGSGELKGSVEATASEAVAVSNAFRLLGSGELPRIYEMFLAARAVSNAFRLLGSGELLSQSDNFARWV